MIFAIALRSRVCSTGIATAKMSDSVYVSVQTTERYLGCKQRIRSAVNDHIGIEPNP
jgi:hypothetical protein